MLKANHAGMLARYIMYVAMHYPSSCAHMYIHTYVCSYVHTYVCTHTHTETQTHTYRQTYTHIHICIHIYLHTYYIHTYIYIHTHMHIHMYRCSYVICTSTLTYCNTAARGLTDIYVRLLRVRSARGRVRIYQ